MQFPKIATCSKRSYEEILACSDILQGTKTALNICLFPLTELEAAQNKGSHLVIEAISQVSRQVHGLVLWLVGTRTTHQKYPLRASLVAQWLRICLPMQGTRV